MQQPSPVEFWATDGHQIRGMLYFAKPKSDFLIINSATAVPQRFYHRFASYLQSQGVTVLTYDYRGIGESAPSNLRGYQAHVSDWGLKDIQAAVDYIESSHAPARIFLVGHSAGGQQAGLITRPERVAAMVTVSAQSGYWRLQGGWQKLYVWFSSYLMIPVLTRAIGYFPWGKLGAQDLPYHVALEWASWCRKPNYLLDDDNWGTKAAVKAMMSAYQDVSFRHLIPDEYEMEKLGHMGFFRKGSEALWEEVHAWLLSQ